MSTLQSFEQSTSTFDIVRFAKSRYSVKAYDSTLKISNENVEKLKDLLRFSPSSVNSQPWHFILASTDEGKDRIAKATDHDYPFNSPSIRKASHVVVFCSRNELDEAFLDQVLQQETNDGRFDKAPEFRGKMKAGREMFINLHRQTLDDLSHWIDKQVYLNVGQFLLGVAALGIDATPMEGINTDVLDQEF